jgi:hypothetical protein
MVFTLHDMSVFFSKVINCIFFCRAAKNFGISQQKQLKLTHFVQPRTERTRKDTTREGEARARKKEVERRNNEREDNSGTLHGRVVAWM